MMDLLPEHVDDLCRGAAFLGAGGGGDPYIGGLIVKRQLDAGKRIRVVDPEELLDDDFVVPTAMMGAPTVLLEKIPSGQEPITALKELEGFLGRRVTATMPTEVGGINSTIPLFVGAALSIPVVDGDGQGRAFPELQMETFAINGVAGTPMAIANEHGEVALLKTQSNHRMEWIARGITIRFGGSAYIANYPMTGRDVRRTCVRRTMTTAIEIGRIIRTARSCGHDPFEALIDYFPSTDYSAAKAIFAGKIVDVRRQTERGFTVGKVTIEGLGGFVGRCTIEFQNENLVARCDGETLAIVPDIISILDSERAVPITNETLRYGQRVRVLTVSVPDIMTTDAALRQFGPAAFGLEETYVASSPHGGRT